MSADRIVVELQSVSLPAGPDAPPSTQWILGLREPIRPDQSALLFPAGTDLVTLRGTPLAEPAGRVLLEQLCNHPGVAGLLPPAGAGGAGAVYVQLTNTGVEDIAWEALSCESMIGDEDTRFLSLSERWAVGRLVPAVPARSARLRHPLRMVAVLSALGVDNLGEWKAVQEAVFRPDAAPVQLLVLTGDQQLHTAVTQAAAGLPAGTLQVGYLPPAPEALADTVSSWRPDILHLFCHGAAADGGSLRLATRSDFERYEDDRDTVSSIVLQTKGITRCLSADGGLLLTLNCCEAAAATEELSSLAYRLTQTGRFAAVVAHRRPVPPAAAHLVCGALYRELLVALAAAADRPPVPWSWPGLLSGARRRLAQLPGQTLDESARHGQQWLNPVVNVAVPELALQVGTEPADGAVASRMAARILRDDPAGAAALLDAARAQGGGR